MCTRNPKIGSRVQSGAVIVQLLSHQHCSHLVPSVYIDRFVINSEVYNDNMTSSQNLHLFNTRTSYGQRCIKYKGSSLWNSLPMPLRLCSYVFV